MTTISRSHPRPLPVGIGLALLWLLIAFAGCRPTADTPDDPGTAEPGTASPGDAHQHGSGQQDGHKHDGGNAHADDGEDGHVTGNSVHLSDAGRRNIGLTLVRIRRRTYRKTIRVPAHLVEIPGRSRLQVSAPFSGIVTRIDAVTGSVVPPGAPLFQLTLLHKDLVTAQTRLLETIAQLDVVQADITRARKLNAEGLSGRLLLERDYEKRRLMATLNAQQQALELHGLSKDEVAALLKTRTVKRRFVVSAPIEPDRTFVLAQLDVEPGEFVEAGQRLCRIVDHGRLLVKAHAWPRDLAAVTQAVKSGWSLEIEPADNPGREPRRTVAFRYAASEVETESQTVAFFCALDNKPISEEGPAASTWRFRPGEPVIVHVPVEEWEDALVLPAVSVVRDGPQSWVFVRDGDDFVRHEVVERHRDTKSVVLDEGSARFGDQRLAREGAYQLHMAIKMATGGGAPVHHHDH